MSSYWVYGIVLDRKIDDLNEEELAEIKAHVESVMFFDSIACRDVSSDKLHEYSYKHVSFLYERSGLLPEDKLSGLIHFTLKRNAGEGEKPKEIEPIKYAGVVDAVIDPNDLLDKIL